MEYTFCQGCSCYTAGMQYCMRFQKPCKVIEECDHWQEPECTTEQTEEGDKDGL